MKINFILDRLSAVIISLFTVLSIGVTLLSGETVADETVADKIEVSTGRQPADTQPERPRSGMSKRQVEQSYGAPRRRAAAIGDPPISSWEYARYIVYFERDRVIHAVLKQRD